MLINIILDVVLLPFITTCKNLMTPELHNAWLTNRQRHQFTLSTITSCMSTSAIRLSNQSYNPRYVFAY